MKYFTITLISLFIFATHYAQGVFPELHAEYLEQTPPGDTAVIFAPGLICTSLNDRDITISPDLDEIIYGVLEKPYSVLVSVKFRDGNWTRQELLPFCGGYNDVEPQFSPDGNRIYFASDRPINASDSTNDYDIWYVKRNGSGWSDPINIGAPVNTEQNEFYPSITENGTLYFTTHDMKICKSQLSENGIGERIILSDSINSGVAEYNAFIAPDESYLIFTSHGWPGGRAVRGDLFISFNKDDNNWSSPVNLGSTINSDVVDMSPSVSPDGKYLFFSSMRVPETTDRSPVKSYEEIFKRADTWGNGKHDIYWVNTDFIKRLNKN